MNMADKLIPTPSRPHSIQSLNSCAHCIYHHRRHTGYHLSWSTSKTHLTGYNNGRGRSAKTKTQSNFALEVNCWRLLDGYRWIRTVQSKFKWSEGIEDHIDRIVLNYCRWLTTSHFKLYKILARPPIILVGGMLANINIYGPKQTYFENIFWNYYMSFVNK